MRDAKTVIGPAETFPFSSLRTTGPPGRVAANRNRRENAVQFHQRFPVDVPMVKLIVAVANGLFALTSLALGVRLLLLARRTRQAPETLLGVGLVLGGFLAHGLAAIVYGVRPSEPLLSVLHYSLRACAASSCGLVLIMAWHIFRRHETWAKALVALVLPVLFAYIFRDLWLQRGAPPADMRRPLYWIFSASLFVPYLWNTIEALRYQRLLRRQWSIGLPADIVLATRMTCWAIGMGAIGSMLLALDFIRLINVLAERTVMDPRLVVSGLGIICTVFLMLSFFPPRWYLKRIELETAARSAA